MLDLAFINLVGSGLLTLVPGRQGDDPAKLIRDLSQVAPSQTTALISDAVQKIWAACDAVKLPRAVAHAHVEALPRVLKDARISLDKILKRNGPQQTPELSPRNFAAEIISASNSRDLGPGIDQVILHYLLEFYIDSMLQNQTLIEELRPFLPTVSAPKKPARPRPASTNTAFTQAIKPRSADERLLRIQRADNLGISVHLLDNIIVRQVNKRKSPDVPDDAVAHDAAIAKSILDAISAEIDRREDNAKQLKSIRTMFAASKLIETDKALSDLEDGELRSAQQMQSTSRSHLENALQLRHIRGLISTLKHDYRKAARHFGHGQRYVERDDHQGRWRLCAKEVDCYVTDATETRLARSLVDAAKACSDAISMMPQTGNYMSKAHAEMRLAGLLIQLGDYENSILRYEMAQQFVESARPAILESGPSELIAHLDLLWANAASEIGQANRDNDLIQRAALAYQSVLRILSENEIEESATLNRKDVSTHMALALFAADLPSNSQELHASAIDIILKTLETALTENKGKDIPPSRHILLAKCHLAIARSLTTDVETPEDLSDTAATQAVTHFQAAQHHFASAGCEQRSEHVQTMMQPQAQSSAA